MRKLIILFAFLICTLITNTQIKAQKTAKLGSSEFQYIFNGQASDTASVHDSAWSMQIFVNKTDALYSNHQIKLTKIRTVTPQMTYYLLGKYFSTDENYDTLAKSVFIGTTTDTIINAKLMTNKNGYNYFTQKIVLSSGTVKISQLKAVYRK